MKIIKSLLCSGGLAMLTSHSLMAQQLENVLVTGTYVPQPMADLSSSVTVLDREFLQVTNKRTVADALRTVPGLLIEELGGPGGLTAVSIRGGEANFTLVLVDGVELNDPTNTRGGSYDFSNLDMASIERIEIVRGAQSAIYGSDALAGVINIITLRSTDTNQQRVRAEWGEDDFSHYVVSATGSAGELGYALQVARYDSGEPTEGSERKNDEANIGLDWAPAEAHELGLHYRYLDGKRKSFPEQSGGPEYAVSRELDHNDYREYSVGANWGWQISESWHSEFKASRFDLKDDSRSPGIDPFIEVPPQSADTKFTRDQYRWVNSVALGNSVNVAVGADYRDEKGDSKGVLDYGFLLPTDFSLDRSTTGVFIESHARVIPDLLLQGSLRYDDPEDFSSETTAKVGGKYDLLDTLSLSANWGEGFKLPSFFALGHALVGNPDLRPETAKSWDAGLHWTPSNALLLGATYFSNEYKDLIDFDSEVFRQVNRGQVDTSGVEMMGDWTASEALRFQGHATYTDIDLQDDASPLLGRPEWTAGATGIWQISSDWRFALDYQWTGEQKSSSRHTGETVVKTLDDFHQWDANLAWQPRDWLAVELAMDNMLDDDSETAVGFKVPGRSVRVALVLSN